MKGQTKSQHIVIIPGIIIYKYHLKKIKFMNDFKKLSISGVTSQDKVELFTKWQKDLLAEHQDVTCPMPPE